MRENLHDLELDGEFLKMTPKIPSIKQKYDKFVFIKIKNFCCVKDTVKRRKDLGKYPDLQIIYLTKDLYPTYIKNSQNWKRQQKPKLKISKRLEQTLYQRGYKNGK